MKFELTYSDASKTVVEISDAELRAWLEGRARSAAMQQADKDLEKKGSVTGATVV